MTLLPPSFLLNRRLLYLSAEFLIRHAVKFTRGVQDRYQAAVARIRSELKAFVYDLEERVRYDQNYTYSDLAVDKAVYLASCCS